MGVDPSYEAWELIGERVRRAEPFLRMHTASGRARQGPLVCRGARPCRGWLGQSARPGRGALQVQQTEVNSKAGQRAEPARLIPVPEDLDANTAALVGALYSTFWNLNPPDNAAWRVIVTRAAEETVPRLAPQRAALGVSMSTTVWGGVTAYVLNPRMIPAAHKNQVIFQIHGGEQNGDVMR